MAHKGEGYSVSAVRGLSCLDTADKIRMKTGKDSTEKHEISSLYPERQQFRSTTVYCRNFTFNNFVFQMTPGN